MNNYANYFLILTLLVFFMLLYVYVSNTQLYKRKVESFYVDDKHTLLSPDKVVYIQSNGIPDVNLKPSLIDDGNESALSVDGTPNGPKSMFTFAYNKVSPECCEDSAYSTNGGCACITKEQKNMFSRRASNNNPNKCGYEENYF